MRRLLPILAAAGLTGCFIQMNQEDEVIPVDESFSRVVVSVDTGSVQLIGGDGPAEVEYDMRWGMGCPEVDTYVWDDTLYVVGECPMGAWSCSTDFEIAVPSGMDVEVEVVTGEIELENLGSVKAELSTGEILVLGAEGDLDLSVTTGKIIGEDLLAERVWAELTTGSISLQFDAEFAEIGADVVTGDVTLEVPEGCYDLDLDVVTGDVDTSGVGCDCSAEAAIHARVVTGSIFVHGA